MAIEGIRIMQRELEEIAELDREVAWRKKKADELKNNLRPLLQAHVEIEMGRFDARLAKRIGRSVPYRKLVIERLGLAVADWFKGLYPPHVFFEVEVVEHAVPPLWKGLGDSSDSRN
jgi:hypothetical protein